MHSPDERGLAAKHCASPLAPWRPCDEAAYAYLLGMYLGDGWIVAVGRSIQLKIVLDGCYQGIIDECTAAIHRVMPDGPVVQRPTPSRAERLDAKDPRWLEAFPQHGPGRKHKRRIALEPWQQDIVDAHRAGFLRGLYHSDGCRAINRFTTRLPSGRVAEYAYPRYFFSNESAEIRELWRATCTALGVRCTQSNRRNLSVSHRPLRRDPRAAPRPEDVGQAGRLRAPSIGERAEPGQGGRTDRSRRRASGHPAFLGSTGRRCQRRPTRSQRRQADARRVTPAVRPSARPENP